MRRESEEKTGLKEILGVPKKGIIFSDLDGVWLNEDANFASPTPSELAVIQEAQNAGYWIVLTSDTGTDGLASFANQLGSNPVVIAENGAVVYLPNEGIKQYQTSLKPFFDTYRPQAANALISNNPTARLITGDATALIKANAINGNPEETLYLVNTARECSFGVYTRVGDLTGNLLVDDQQTQETERLLNKLLEGSDNNLVCRRYPTIGSCLVKDPTIVKWKTVDWFISQFPPSLSFYMIGDTINDSMQPIADKVITCAVGNASEELKAVARISGGIVAPENATIAQGANYIMKEILQRRGN